MIAIFYITWSPPCQKPLEMMQLILNKKKAEWADKVRILGICFDQTKEQMVEHIKNRGWSDIEHFHRHKSDCGEDFGVPKIPFAFILDK